MTTRIYHPTTDHRTTTTDPTAIRATIRTCLLAAAIGTAAGLTVLTLGMSFWLALVLGLAIPVIAAWFALCGTLEANEPALDAMLTERRNTLRATVPTARNGRAYTGDTVRLDEVQR